MEVRSENDKCLTCFVIMPITDPPGYDPGHFKRVYEHLIRPAVTAAGYVPIRSDDTVKTDYIVVGIVQKIVDAEMILCDLSGRNPNVMYELGVRHAFNKPVVLMKDRRTENCFDIQGLRYMDYDETLCVDSVEKDISRIKASLAETGNSNPADMNSIVKLAGIKTAETPATQFVSPDTTLILSSIAALEKHLALNNQSESTSESFLSFLSNGNVILPDSAEVCLGDEIYDGPGNSVGSLVDIHPADKKIFVRQPSGKIVVFSGKSVRSKNLTYIPF